MKKSDLNLAVIQNFILHITHASEQDYDNTPMSFTADELYRMAVDYIEEDHVDGKENPEDEITTNVEILVGKDKMRVDLEVNKNGNLAIKFTDEDLAKMPDGFVFEGFENELIIYPFKP